MERRYPAALALTLGAVLSAAIALYARTFDATDSLFPIKPHPRSGMNPVPFGWSLAASIMLGTGLGSLIALFVANRRRLASVFAHNAGRMICAAILAFLAPVFQVWGIPVAFGYAVLRAATLLVSGVSEMTMLIFVIASFFGLGLPIAYVISSLIISGVRSRFLRVALFGQVWLAIYGAALLVLGFYQGNV